MGLFSNKSKDTAAEAEGAYVARADEAPARSRGKSSSAKAPGEPVDPVLPEKKRARRRLVGAVALVLAVIIGLPMVLDSEPKPLAGDIAIDIPSKDKPYSANNTARPNSSVSTAESLDKNEELVDSSEFDAKPEVKSEIKPEPKPEIKSEIKPEIKPELKPELKPEIKPVPKPEPKPVPELKADARADVKVEADAKAKAQADDAKAKAKADAKAKAAMAILEDKGEPKNSKYVVQVAALAAQEKIDELQEKLRSAGIQSHTQKVATESGNRTRIRVGPFSGKDEALKMREKLIKLGLNGTLIEQ